MSTELTVSTPTETSATFVGFDDPKSFAHMQRVAKVFTSSMLVPESFRGDANYGNVIIALNMARRMGADPMAVMQNIYIVHGKPAWSSQFIIACINSCGRYSPLRFTVSGTGDAKTCVAWATEKGTGERLEGPPVSIGMAKTEGWLTKNGSKWKTMEELMLRYRAATFFGRLYAPEILMGMQSMEEVVDVEGAATATSVLTPAPIKPVFSTAIPASTAKQAAAQEPDSGLNLPKMIRGLLKQAGLTEDALLDWMRATVPAFASAHTLEQAAEADLKALGDLTDDWSNVVVLVKKGGSK